MKKHLPFIILILILVVYLGLKTLPEDGWTGWGIFSAQTLLSSEHWAKDGFFANKFLFIPIGYSQIVRYLDEPEMRHHARGTITGELIGNRLYYTHYPSGYLFPYAFLMKLGVIERHWFRLLALVFSFTALILLYCFFNLISGPVIAFFAILYYSVSTMFLDYADSLANQPIDDLLRAAILVLSVLAVKYVIASPKEARQSQNNQRFTGLLRFARNDKFYNILIWFFYFLLSVSSYDSTFFIFIWLVGLDVIVVIARRSEATTKQSQGLPCSLRSLAMTNMKKWLFYASAPVLGFLLQTVQNIWYLGWKDFLLDLKGSFLFRTSDGPGKGFLEKHIRSTFSPLAYMTDLRIRFAMPIILIMATAFACLKNKVSIHWPNFKYFAVLLLAGLAYAFVFVSSGYFPYQGRQWMPWFGLLLGSATVLLISWKSLLSTLTERNPSLPKFSIIVFILLLITVLTIWLVQINRTIAYIKDWPNHKANTKMIEFYKFLKFYGEHVEPSQIADGVIFYTDNNFKTDYPQPDPIEEYYAGMTILSFRNFQDFLRDYNWLKDRVAFDAIIVSPQKELTDGIKQILELPGEIKFVNDKYVLIPNNEVGPPLRH